MTCPVLGDGETARALPVIRIVAPEGDYDYQNKYFTDDVAVPLPERPAGRRGARDPRIVARRLPHARLPRLGPRRPDAARQRPQAVPARDEHLARHDRPLAGADVGARGRHRATSSCACSCSPARRSIRRAAPATEPDRWRRDACADDARRAAARPTCALMNATAACCFVARRRVVLAALARAAGWRASRCSRSASIRVDGDVDAQQRLDDPRQRGAAARRQLLHARSRGGAARLRVGALGAPGGRAARLAEPAARCGSRSTGRSRCGAATRRRPRSWSTASARCSRPTSATSRTTSLPTLERPRRQLGATCSRCTAG